MLAAYGELVFHVSPEQVYTFDELSKSVQLDTETQEVIGSKPSTYIKGPGLDSLSLKIVLDTTLGVDVRAELVMWENTCASGIPHRFSIGDQPVSIYPWLLKSIDEPVIKVGPGGIIIRAEVTIKLEEFVRAGSAKSSTVSTGLDSSVSAALFGPDASGIRSNPGVDEAIANGLMLEGG